MVRPFNGKTELYIVVGLKNTLREILEGMDKKQIIAVDFDGTLCFSTWPDTGEPNQPLIDYLKIHKKAGDKLILWTCRSGVILDKALSWCREVAKLEFDAVNDNVPEVIDYYGNNSRKIFCDIYIDDKACVPDEFCGKCRKIQ